MQPWPPGGDPIGWRSLGNRKRCGPPCGRGGDPRGGRRAGGTRGPAGPGRPGVGDAPLAPTPTHRAIRLSTLGSAGLVPAHRQTAPSRVGRFAPSVTCGWSRVATGSQPSTCLLHCLGQLGGGCWIWMVAGGRSCPCRSAPPPWARAPPPSWPRPRPCRCPCLRPGACCRSCPGPWVLLEGVGQVVGLMQQVLCLPVSGALLGAAVTTAVRLANAAGIPAPTAPASR
jgi:hypothetical protein